MAAKIGIFGEGTVTTAGTVTLYTVPADKASRVRVSWAQPRGNSTQGSWLIGSPGDEIQIHFHGASNVDNWSGILEQTSSNPPDALLTSDIGSQEVDLSMSLTTLTSGEKWVIGPLNIDYFLSTGDTVKWNISSSNVSDTLVQVMGVEDDA